MMPAISGTEMLTKEKLARRANRSIVVYFYNFYVHPKLFQNKRLNRGSYATGCFVTWIFKRIFITMLIRLFKRFTDQPQS